MSAPYQKPPRGSRETETLDCEVVRTSLGSVALRDRTTEEVMHPIIGAREESELLYIEGSRLKLRLQAPLSETLNVFDVGLGAGTNALLARLAQRSLPEPKRRLHIASFDRSDNGFTVARNAPERAHFGFSEEPEAFESELLEEGATSEPGCDWTLHLGELPETLGNEPENSADIVFWDPFSPDTNPTLWSVASFRRLFHATRPGATVHTYSSSTSVRTAFLLAGFFVGEGPKTGNARPTTIASREHADLEVPLGGRFLERVARSSCPFPADAPEDALERLRAHPQFRET